MTRTWTVDGEQFDEDALSANSRKVNMEIYNRLAVKAGQMQLGIASTHQASVDRVVKMLDTRYSGEKAKATEKPRGRNPAAVEAVTHAAAARVVKTRTARLLSRIRKLKAPKENERLRFWDRYRDGMTMEHIVTTNGLDDTQVRFWIRLKCVELTGPTEKEMRDAGFKENTIHKELDRQGRGRQGELPLRKK